MGESKKPALTLRFDRRVQLEVRGATITCDAGPLVAQGVLEPMVERYQKKGIRPLFRADAAFAKPEVYQFLEARSAGSAICLPSNEVLGRQFAPLLKRPQGEAPSRPVVRHRDFTYQAGSWDRARRVVAKSLS